MAGIEGENKGKRVVRRDSSRTPPISAQKRLNSEMLSWETLRAIASDYSKE